MTALFIVNGSKKAKVEDFIPKYLEEKPREKSLEEQQRDMAAFKEKYHKARREAGLE